MPSFHAQWTQADSSDPASHLSSWAQTNPTNQPSNPRPTTSLTTPAIRALAQRSKSKLPHTNLFSLANHSYQEQHPDRLHNLSHPIPPQPMGNTHHRSQPSPCPRHSHTQLPCQTGPQAEAQDICCRCYPAQKTSTNPCFGTPILPHFSWSSITASHTK